MSSRRPAVAILTLRNDLHALLVRHELCQVSDVACHIVETDQIAGTGLLTWTSDRLSTAIPCVQTSAPERLNVKALDVVWLRRLHVAHEYIARMEPIPAEVVSNDCRAAVMGMFLTDFTGTWINDPRESFWAENKLIQLRAAQLVGFGIPRTLVSQDASVIRSFCQELENEVVLKTVRGSARHPLFAIKVTDDVLSDTAGLEASPAIYQEYVPGRRHIRAVCFGGDVFAFMVESDSLDWRSYMDYEIRSTTLDGRWRTALLDVLRLLHLRMGVFDLKLLPDGTPVWLEVNPQGQFLFLEALTGVPLAAHFARFLRSEMMHAHTRIAFPV